MVPNGMIKMAWIVNFIKLFRAPFVKIMEMIMKMVDIQQIRHVAFAMAEIKILIFGKLFCF